MKKALSGIERGFALSFNSASAKRKTSVWCTMLILIILTGLLPPGRAFAATQAELYVAPGGSGTVCSAAAPCSLESARDQVRTMNGNMTGDIIVYLLDGTYTLTNTFELNQSDSGTNGFNVIYTAAPGAKPLLSGGREITDWSLFDSAKQIYRAPVPAGFDTRQLYVDGTRATRAMGETSPEGWKSANAYGYSSESHTSDNANEYAIIDLGTVKKIQSVRLYPRTDIQAAGGGTPNFPVDFTIEGSSDGLQYTVLKAVAGQANPNGAVQEYQFQQTDARYVKINVTRLGVPASTEPGAYRLQLLEVEVPIPQYTYENAALHKPTGTNNNFHVPPYYDISYLTDGNFASWYLSNGSPDKNIPFSVSVDLQSVQKISSVKLYPENYGSNTNESLWFPTALEIGISNDGVTYQVARTVENIPNPHGEALEISIPPTNARHVRVKVLENGAPRDGLYRLFLSEMEVYVQKEDNAALHRPTGTNSNFKVPPYYDISYLTDGNFASWYLSNGSPDKNIPFSVSVDLGSALTISSVKLYPENYGSNTNESLWFPTALEIGVSNDGVNYLVAKTVENIANPHGAALELAIPPTNGRHVRVKVLENGAPRDGLYRLFLSEMEVYAHAEDNAALHRSVTTSSSQETTSFGARQLTDGLTAPSSFYGYVMPDSTMASWHNIGDVEAVVMRKWQMNRCPVDSVYETTIVMQNPCWASVGTISNEKPVWIENAYELLNAPGEWYLDKTGAVDGSGTPAIYYKPLSSQNITSANVIAPVLQTAVRGVGTLDQPVHNIEFRGIAFAYFGWTAPTYGYIDVQGGWLYQNEIISKTPPAVTFRAAKSVRLVRNVFAHLGGSGLNFEYGSQDNEIIGNVIEDISGGGLFLGSIDDPHPADLRLIVKNNTVRNNYIRNTGVEYFDSVAIWTGYTEHSVIEHNEIDNVSYSGMSIGWGFGRYDNPPSSAKNNVIRYNLVQHVNRTLHDGGGIYTLGAQPGSVISDNFVNYVATASGDGDGIKDGAIYLDEGSRYFSVHHNVVQHSYRWVNMWRYNIQDNVAQYNYSDTANYRNDGTNNTVSDNTTVTDGNWPTEAQDIMNNAGIESEYQDIKLNSTAGVVPAFERGYKLQPDSPGYYFGLEPAIQAVHIEGQGGAARINRQTRTVDIYMPYGTDITALQPTITLLNGHSVQPASGVAQNFTSPVQYFVTAPGGGQSTWTVKVHVLDDLHDGPQDTVFVKLNPYLDDVSNWSGTRTAGQGSITFNSLSTYNGTKFDNELLDFNMEVPLTGNDWVGFVLRSQTPGMTLFQGDTTYHFVVKRDVWELQKWVAGAQEMLIGEIPGLTARWGVLPNTQFTSNTKHRIQAGAINVPEGVRLVLYCDGIRVFDVVDTVDPIREPGYMTIYPMTGAIKLSGVEDPVLQSISLSGVNARMLVGDRAQTVVTAVYSNSSTLDVTGAAIFKSSDPSVATVSSTGAVTALQHGTTVIKAMHAGQETTVQLVVEMQMEAMRNDVQQYIASGSINSTFGADLAYRLNIIQLLLDQGATDTAAAYMQDFLNHINDPAVRQQNLILAAAADVLNAEGTALMQDWLQ